MSSQEDDKTPVYEDGAMRLLRDSVAPVADTDTGKTCPACAQENGSPGDGLIRQEKGSIITTMPCPVCDGKMWVTMSNPLLAAWEAGNKAKKL